VTSKPHRLRAKRSISVEDFQFLDGRERDALSGENLGPLASRGFCGNPNPLHVLVESAGSPEEKGRDVLLSRRREPVMTLPRERPAYQMRASKW
jgi:hypothetical protein